MAALNWWKQPRIIHINMRLLNEFLIVTFTCLVGSCYFISLPRHFPLTFLYECYNVGLNGSNTICHMQTKRCFFFFFIVIHLKRRTWPSAAAVGSDREPQHNGKMKKQRERQNSSLLVVCKRKEPNHVCMTFVRNLPRPSSSSGYLTSATPQDDSGSCEPSSHLLCILLNCVRRELVTIVPT